MKKTIIVLVMFFPLLFAFNTLAGEDISGSWWGKLVTGPDKEMTLDFNIKHEPDGSLSVILNSPDANGIKNVRANSVDYTSGNLRVDVADLNGSYEGIVKDGKIDGKWKQSGTSFPLTLTFYEKFSREVMEKLLGSWCGTLKAIEFNKNDDEDEEEAEYHKKKRKEEENHPHMYRFEMSEKGEFIGSFGCVEGESAQMKIKYQLKLTEANENRIVCVHPVEPGKPGGKFIGRLTDGKIVGGMWLVYGDREFPVKMLTLTKGKCKTLVSR